MASSQSCIEGIRREATGSETALTSLLPTVLKGTTTFTSLTAFLLLLPVLGKKLCCTVNSFSSQVVVSLCQLLVELLILEKFVWRISLEHLSAIFRSISLIASGRNKVSEALRSDQLLIPVLQKSPLLLNNSLSNLYLVLVFLPFHLRLSIAWAGLIIARVRVHLIQVLLISCLNFFVLHLFLFKRVFKE